MRKTQYTTKQKRKFEERIKGKRGITVKPNYVTTILITSFNFVYYVAVMKLVGKEVEREYIITDELSVINQIINENNSLLTESQLLTISGLILNKGNNTD